jgi:hypothetical protein
VTVVRGDRQQIVYQPHVASVPERRMSISVVNGYVCTSCDDVAKAKKGENPHPPPGSDDGQDGKNGPVGASSFDGPAVTFGGVLGALFANAIDPVGAARAPDEVSQRITGGGVDLLV